MTIKDHAGLTGLLFNDGNQQPARKLIDVPFLQQIQLVNLPNLSNSIRLYPWTAEIQLDGLPALQGLAIQGPLPERAVLRGFRDLRWFAAGGRAIDDAVADELLACGNLQHLTLAYANVSNDKIRDLLHANPIRTLDLTGTEIDDAVFENWQGMKELQELILDDTRVTELTLNQLIAAENLSMLSINGIVIGEPLLTELSKLQKLSVLRIAGTPCSPEMLSRLVKALPLTELDISGQTFSAEHAQAIIDSGLMRPGVLGLRDSKIDPQAISKLANSVTSMSFDIAGADLPARMQGNLLAAGRLVVEEEEGRVVVFSGFGGTLEGTQTEPDRVCPFEAIIDVKQFAPNKLNSVYE